ncbi:hypothetical protein NDU88_004684 [Pleurodeles waltl]|uniref:Endonuclease/exonuclease/phosphatase domain-containing protein n=1 Tax=Pleurodeles waltl TaxID=8319 RepID=A0AAV7M712_PLEWA|nr:hypothetical protein NDU88_004684 [Pleurodeles waltl]
MNPSSEPDIAIAIPESYKINKRDRTNKPKGGIAIVHRSSRRISTNTHDALDAAEHLHFQIYINAHTTLRGTLVYRPPGPHPQFCDAIADTISTHALASTGYMLLSDLNFHLQNTGDSNCAALLDNLANLGLNNSLQRPPTQPATHLMVVSFTSMTSHI